MNAEEAKEKARELFNARNTNLDDLTFYDLEIKISQALLQTDALAREEAAKIAEQKFYPHTFASENSDEYIEQWEIGKSIARAIRDSNKGEKA